MGAALAGLYLAVTILTAVAGGRALRGVASTAATAPARYWLAGGSLVLLGAAFLFPFFVIGSLELLADAPRLSLPALLVVAAVQLTVAVVAAWRATTPVRPVDTGDLTWRSLSGLTAMAALLLFAVLAVMLALGYPRGFEVVAYHLPIALRMFQTGSLGVWDQAFMHTFPANMSLYTGLLLQLVPERLVSVANLPFVLLASFATYGLARAAGGRPADCLMAALGLISVPVVAFSGFELGADVAGIAFLGLAYLVVLAAPDRRLTWFALAGMAAGLAFGFKSLHLVGAAFLGLVVLWRAWTDDGGGPAVLRALRAGVVYGLAFLLFAGCWLLRNYVELGNPLYPVHFGAVFDALGWAAAPDIDYATRVTTQLEWVDGSWQWLTYPWVEGHYKGQNFKHSSGLGAFFAAVGPLAWLVALAVTGRRLFAGRRAGRDDAAAVAGALCLASGFIVLVWWILVDRQPRYLMGALVLALPLYAPMVRRLSRSGARVMRGLAAAAVVVMLAIIGSKQVLVLGSALLTATQHGRAGTYEYPAEVDDLPAGSVVLNLSDRTRNYLLYGAGLSNRVISPTAIDPVLRDLGTDRVDARVLCAFGADHVYTEGEFPILLSPDVELERIGEMSLNPTNGKPLPTVRTIWRIVEPKSRCG